MDAFGMSAPVQEYLWDSRQVSLPLQVSVFSSTKEVIASNLRGDFEGKMYWRVGPTC